MARSGAFISYARADGEAFAAALRERLAREAPDLRVWQDRAEIEGGVGWWRQIEEALERVEFLVIVMTPGVLASEITRKEWRAARQAGVAVFPVVGPGFTFDDPRLPGWMSRAHTYDLAAQWDTFIAHLRRGAQPARVPFMAPPRSGAYVARTREFAALRDRVLDARTGDAVPGTTTLAGAGGFGKTTLATALCHDDEVGAAFDDGILWATLGQTPNVQGELTRLYAALVGERPGFVSVEDAAQALADKLEHKRCLLVVDDVWDVAHLRPFLRGGPACARLVTTRQARVADEGSRIAVDQMTAAEAVAVLIARLPEAPADVEPLRRLSHRLGEWPLLLRLAGAALRQRLDRGDSLEGALRYVDRALDKRGVLAFDRERPLERNEAVASTLGVSLDLLAAADRARCAELAVFPEDVAIPCAALGELWGLDELDVEEALARLDDASLLEFDLGTGVVRLHDVMRACFATLLGDAVVPAHERLLAAWADRRRLPHRYAWRWLAHHLAEAGRADELRALLLDFDWLQAKLDATDIYALLADFAHAPQDERLQWLHKVLLLSSHVLAKDRAQLATQLLGRLASSAQPPVLALPVTLAPGRRAWLRPLTPSLVGPGGALVRTLESPGMPDSVAVTPDGRWIVSGTSGGTLCAWELASGTLVRELRVEGDASRGTGQASGVPAVEGPGAAFALLPDGRVLFTHGSGIALWDPATDDPPRLVATARDGSGSLAVSGDGRRALLGSRRGVLTLIDVETGAVLAQPVAQRLDVDTGETIAQRGAHRLSITTVAFSGDGRFGLTGSYDKTLRVWDLATHELVDTLYPPHDDVVYAAVAARDVPLAASAGGDGRVRLWDLETLACRATLEGHAHRVYDVALSPDGTTALSASHDRTIRVWDVATAATRATLHGHSDAVFAVAFVPGSRSAVSASKDGTIRVWALEAAEARASTQEHEGWIQALAVAPDGGLAITAGQDHRLRVWDTTDPRAPRVTRVLHRHDDAVSALALHAASGTLVSGSRDRRLVVWNLADGSVRHRLPSQVDAIGAVAITGDGALALSGSDDGDVKLWDLAAGRQLRRWDAHRRAVTMIAPLPGTRQVLTASMDGTLALWDMDSGAKLHQLPAHLGGVSAGALSPDGDHALTGGVDGTLRLWRLPSFELVRTVAGHGARVRAIAFCADGRRAFTGAYDRYLKAWALPELDALAAFAADAAIAAAGASADGTLVVAGDAQGCAHFLEFVEAGVRRQAA